jgi:predicted RNA polymerase sigma factor
MEIGNAELGSKVMGVAELDEIRMETIDTRERSEEAEEEYHDALLLAGYPKRRVYLPQTKTELHDWCSNNGVK